MTCSRVRPADRAAAAWLLAAATILALTALAPRAGAPQSTGAATGKLAPLRAGASKVEITPRSSTWLSGYGPRRSDGVLDPIFHRVLALDTGDAQLYLISSDLCLFSPGFHDSVMAELQKATGIDPGHVLWSVTHSHAAPEVGPPDMYKALLGRSDHEWDRDYSSFATAALIDAVTRARASLEPARIVFGSGTAMANINRRAKDVDGTVSLGLNPEGPVDRQFNLIRLTRPDGSPIALVANYAMHGTVMSGQNLKVSGDGPGIVTAYLEEKLGGIVLYVNGAAGDIAPIYSVYATPNAGHLPQFRVLLGNRIIGAVAALGPGSSEVRLRHGEKIVDTPRKPDLTWPDGLAAYGKTENGRPMVRLPLRFVRINDTVIWTAPVEMFCEIAMDVRAQSPFSHTFYFGYTNGWLGYLPTAKGFEEGGYEPRTSPFLPAVEADVRQAVTAFIHEFSRSAGPSRSQAAAPATSQGRGVVEAPAADDPLNADADLSPKPPVVPLTPAEQASRFWLPPGYRLQPILSEPDIEEPAQIAFDGNGRMFVLELRGYDQTLDGLDLTPPIGRISVHEDRNDDGVYEHHRVFVDKLVFPRFVLPYGAGAILASESNADEVWKFTDTDGDGVADRKDLFASNFGRAGNIEHQPSSLFWAMDNWLYSTVNSFRIRPTPQGLLREPTGANGAQWGVTQDNDGKVYFQAGASGIPGYFQLPVHYGTFNVSDQLEPDLNITWGAPILIGDIQAGLPGTRLPDGSLMRSTAAAGNDVYRGHRLPADLVGDYLYGEVVARIVRRLKPVTAEGLTQLRNAYPRSEFIRSLDPLFRPTDTTTAPDGTIYIADMYRGVIEGAPWAKAGTYLRQKIDQYQLHRILGKGRIWRLTYDGMARDRTKPRMLGERPAQLVAHLSHPNGWWRDTAQQLLVLARDTSVTPALQRLVRGASGNLVARFHALWTLEGLGTLDAALVREQLKDANPRMRIQAIRASETLYKAGDRSFAADYRSLAKDTDTGVAIQALLTLSLFKAPDLPDIVKAAQSASPARGIQEIGRQLLRPAPSLTFGGRGGSGLSADVQATLQRGATTYKELCSTCHGADGRGTPVEGVAGGMLAPPLVASNRVLGHRDYVIKTLLHGMTGPLDGRTYGIMVPMGTNTDEWIASVASYVRSGFGASSWLVTPADVARVRAATSTRKTPWTYAELDASLPRALAPDTTWKLTASHNPSAAGGGTNFSGWSSGAPQQAGMWFQVELPAAVVLSEIEFESPALAGRTGAAGATYPRAFRVELSGDGATWSAVADGKGSGSPTTIPFAPTLTRFLRVSLTETPADAPAWVVRNIKLLAVADGAATSRPSGR